MKRLWVGLSPRDQRLAVVGALIAATFLWWSLVWLPLTESRSSLRDEAVTNAAALAWMRPASRRLVELGGAPVARATNGRSLLARVDASARESGLGGSLVSVEPQDRRRIRAQFSGADFDVFVTWLEGRAADGMLVEELSVQRASGAGRVDARLVLREGDK